MPHPVKVTFDTESQQFPAGTTPTHYEVTITDPMSTPVDVPYGGPHEADFPTVAAGLWTVSVEMQQADGAALGTLVSGEVDVPEDDVALDAPIAVHLTVGP